MPAGADARPHHLLLGSRFGPVVVVWQRSRGRPEVCRVFLSSGTSSAIERLKATYPSSTRQTCPELRRLAADIRRFLEGEPVRFDLGITALRRCSGFQRRVLVAEHGIPRGRVSTYGRIAAHVGRPKASRAVGSALSHNPFPLIVPCHRAVRSDGGLGGFQGGTRMKRALLALEGIRFATSGNVLRPGDNGDATPYALT